MVRDSREKKVRWLNGYKFWRGQYILRNEKFIELQKEFILIKNEFADKARCLMDNDVLEKIGLGLSKNPPIVNEEYVEVYKSLPKDVSDIGKEMAKIDYKIAKYYPNYHIPKKVDTNNIIRSIVKDTFDFGIYVSNISDESLLYPGMLRSDLSRYILLVNSSNPKSRFFELKIDCTGDIGHILSTVCSIVEAEKKKYEEDFESCKDFISLDLELYLIKKKSGVAYSVGTGSDCSRAIGLWIYDYIEKNGCTQSQAVSMIKGMEFMDRLGKKMSDETTLKRMHRRTKACVDAAEVLKIQ